MELSFNLKKKFGTFSLDIAYSAGDRTGVFGPSGSGKSTLVNLLAGLEHPDSGWINLDDDTLFDSICHINLPPEQRRIGIVFQHPHLFPHFSVRNNLLYGFRRCAARNRRITLESIVQVLQIENLLDRRVANLSGGEKQRVAIGRAVLSNPKLLLMDEPLSALDDKLKFQIIPFLKKICGMFHIPYLFISHSLLEMRLMTDQVLSLSDGNAASRQTAEELAVGRMQGSTGYTNLLRFNRPQKIDGYFVYQWGDARIFVSDGGQESESLFELSSTDIILCKRHPQAISARNLLKCRIQKIREADHRIGVELDCGGSEKLIAEIVRESAHELEIREGTEIYAAIKAVAFRRLY